MLVFAPSSCWSCTWDPFPSTLSRMDGEQVEGGVHFGSHTPPPPEQLKVAKGEGGASHESPPPPTSPNVAVAEGDPNGRLVKPISLPESDPDMNGRLGTPDSLPTLPQPELTEEERKVKLRADNTRRILEAGKLIPRCGAMYKSKRTGKVEVCRMARLRGEKACQHHINFVMETGSELPIREAVSELLLPGINLPSPTPHAAVSKYGSVTSPITYLIRRHRGHVDLLNLRDEISVLQAVLDQHLTAPQGICPECKIPRNTKGMVDTVEAIGRLIKNLHEMEHGRRVVLTHEYVHVLLQKFSAVVVKYIPEEHREALAGEIERLSAPSPGEVAQEGYRVDAAMTDSIPA